MTLKSFYSHNHRLPSPWIHAVTPAPACLPPQLPKLPAGRQTGRLPSYCQGGQRRGRTGWERFNATHTLRASTREGDSDSQTDTERKRNTDTSHGRHTQTTHCPHSSDMPTPRFAHHFPNSDTELRESDSPRFTGIHKSHRYTQITSTHSKILSTHNSEYAHFQIHKDKSNFQILRFTNTQVQRQCGPTQLLDPQIHVP